MELVHDEIIPVVQRASRGLPLVVIGVNDAEGRLRVDFPDVSVVLSKPAIAVCDLELVLLARLGAFDLECPAAVVFPIQRMRVSVPVIEFTDDRDTTRKRRPDAEVDGSVDWDRSHLTRIKYRGLHEPL